MKKFISALALILVMTAGAQGQVIVKVKPVAPKVVVVKKVRPAGKIWIKGHWKWSPRQHRYVWVKGRHMKVRRNHVWVSGRWKQVRGGWLYVPGRWSRV